MGKVRDAIISWPPPSNNTSSEKTHVVQQTVAQLETQLLGQDILDSTNNRFCNSSQGVYVPQFVPVLAQQCAVNNVKDASSEGYPSPLIPLGRGGFIYNYPPLYTMRPIPPFSNSVSIMNNVSTTLQSEPMSPPTSPLGNSISSPELSLSAAAIAKKEKIEKYRQKRSKRNYHRPVDQARRERAQQRVRDEFGHFVPNSKKLEVEKDKFSQQAIEVKHQMEALKHEYHLLQSKLNQTENELAQQQSINTDLIQFLHENRILWSTISPNDVFNTLNPNSNYADAFKEKVDFANIELNWTDSPLFEQVRNECGVDWENCSILRNMDVAIPGSLS